MSEYLWQANDEFSVYNDSTDRVYLGYVNMAAPGWKGSFSSVFGSFAKNTLGGRKNTVEKGCLLNPMEQFYVANGMRSKLKLQTYGRFFDSQGNQKYEPLNGRPPSQPQHNVEVLEVVFNRLRIPDQFQAFKQKAILYINSKSLQFQYQPLLINLQSASSFGALHLGAQKEMLELAQRMSTEYALDFNSRFANKLAGFCRQTYENNPNFMARYKGALANTPGLTSSNVFGRTVDDEALPQMDMLTAIYARAIINPDGDGPNIKIANLEEIANLEVPWIREMLIDPSIAKAYPITSAKLPGRHSERARRSLVYVARVLCMDNEIAKSFGTGTALVKIFNRSSIQIKSLIVNTCFPYTQNADLNFFGNPSPLKYNKGELEFVGRSFVSAMLLLDCLNKENKMRPYTVAYLKWVKSKCLYAKARKAMALPVVTQTSPVRITRDLDMSKILATSAIDLSQISMPADQGTPSGSRNAGMREALMEAARNQKSPTDELMEQRDDIMGPGRGGAGSSSSGDEVTEVSEEEIEILEPDEDPIPQADPVVVDIDDLPSEVAEQMLESETSAAEGIDPKYIYIGSAVALLGVIGTVLYVRRQRESSKI